MALDCSFALPTQAIAVVAAVALHRSPTTFETIRPTPENREYNFPTLKLSPDTMTSSRSIRPFGRFRWWPVVSCRTTVPNSVPASQIVYRVQWMRCERVVPIYLSTAMASICAVLISWTAASLRLALRKFRKMSHFGGHSTTTWTAIRVYLLCVRSSSLDKW